MSLQSAAGSRQESSNARQNPLPQKGREEHFVRPLPLKGRRSIRSVPPPKWEEAKQ